MKTCPGSNDLASPRFIERGFCPRCKLSVHIHPDGSCKRHYPNGLRVALGPREGYHHVIHLR